MRISQFMVGLDIETERGQAREQAGLPANAHPRSVWPRETTVPHQSPSWSQARCPASGGPVLSRGRGYRKAEATRTLDHAAVVGDDRVQLPGQAKSSCQMNGIG